MSSWLDEYLARHTPERPKDPSASGADEPRAERMLARPARDPEGLTRTDADAPRGVDPWLLCDSCGGIVAAGPHLGCNPSSRGRATDRA